MLILFKKETSKMMKSSLFWSSQDIGPQLKNADSKEPLANTDQLNDIRLNRRPSQMASQITAYLKTILRYLHSHNKSLPCKIMRNILATFEEALNGKLQELKSVYTIPNRMQLQISGVGLHLNKINNTIFDTAWILQGCIFHPFKSWCGHVQHFHLHTVNLSVQLLQLKHSFGYIHKRLSKHQTLQRLQYVLWTLTIGNVILKD